jgi:glycosyltransferase involved in cell wall biosynthesis
MKIGIDASRLRAEATGVGRYTEGILAALDKVMPQSTFVLYARRECGFVPPSARWSVLCDRHPIWSRIPIVYWIRYRLKILARSNDIDLFWAPNTFIPKGMANIVPCVTTVLDFRHELEPENLPPITRHAHRKWFDGDVRSAARVVAISEGTSMRMQNLLGRKADAIALPAVSVLPTVGDRSDAALALAALGVKQPFLLTVGGSPCKNLVGAADAVAMMKARGSLVDHQLVMVGAGAWGRRDRFKKRKNVNKWIKRLGYVDDSTLAALYSLADALVFPSFYEGFGMPVFEARAMGCRVVTTDSPELREAGGTDATYVKPTAEGIVCGLEDALSRTPPPVRKLEHNWIDAAEVMAAVFYSVTASLKIAGRCSAFKAPHEPVRSPEG